MYLGAIDERINEDGIAVQLVGNTYLPQGGIRTVATGKGWYEVWQNDKYVGYIKPGGKNGIFVPEGSPVVWPPKPVAPTVSTPTASTPTVSTPTVNTPVVTTQIAPAPIASTPARTESIPTSASNVAPPTAVSTLAPTAGGQSIIETPLSSAPITDVPSNTAVDTITPASKVPTWILWSAIGGVALVMLKRGKRRGR